MTPKQALLLSFIEKFLAEHDGVSPSFEEMKVAIGLKSKSGIHKLVSSLIERGYLESIPNKARALRVLKPVPRTKKSDSLKVADWIDENHPDVRQIPMYGKIAAGTPILAVNDNPDTIPVFGLPSNYGDFYALTVAGDSMIEAGIFDGDTVVVESSQEIGPRDIAVALVDGEEVTLKYIKRVGSSVVLVPANKDYQNRILDASRVKIQGKLVQLIRSY